MHPKKVKEIISIRKERKLTSNHIARKLKMLLRTVSRNLIRAKLSQQKDIEDRDEDPPWFYEHEALGAKIHLDIKKLRNSKYDGVRDCRTSNLHKSMYKVAGTQFKHIALDDLLRYASVSTRQDETAESVTKHLIEYAASGMLS